MYPIMSNIEILGRGIVLSWLLQGLILWFSMTYDICMSVYGIHFPSTNPNETGLTVTSDDCDGLRCGWTETSSRSWCRPPWPRATWWNIPRWEHWKARPELGTHGIPWISMDSGGIFSPFASLFERVGFHHQRCVWGKFKARGTSMGPEWVIEIGLRCCFSCLEGLAHRVRPDLQSYLSPYKLCYHGLNVGASRTRYCLSTSRRPPSR